MRRLARKDRRRSTSGPPQVNSVLLDLNHSANVYPKMFAFESENTFSCLYGSLPVKGCYPPTHVLVHFVKSACLYSVNFFSTFFSANNQHNCPILFCICPTYLPAGLPLRFPSKGNYIIIFRESDLQRHLFLNE